MLGKVVAVDQFLDVIEQMKRGTIPTQRHFVCPKCGGPAHVQVSRASKGPDRVNLSAWCEKCHAAVEADGVREWPGSESIVVEAPTDARPTRPRRVKS
jgi:hypothetical protein